MTDQSDKGVRADCTVLAAGEARGDGNACAAELSVSIVLIDGTATGENRQAL